MPHSIKIRGIAPPDLPGLPEPLRRQFWSIVAPIALAVKDKELAAGLDAQGEPLRPISPRTRKYRRSAMTPSGKGDPSAPPLMPAYQKSRVRSLLAARAFATHCELYWRYDPFTGASFDVILTYQRAMGRDVFGVSASALATIRRQSWAAWAKWKKAGLAPTEKRSAFPAAALQVGPQSRIAGIIARSAEPGAGASAPVGVGKLNTRFITRGINAPKVKDLKASTTRSGAMTGAEWRKFFTGEVGPAGKGGMAVKPRAPQPKAPVVARVAMKPQPKPETEPRPEPITLPVFGRNALAAARAVPESIKYSDSKVWIIDAYDAYQARYGPISLTEYKAQLLEAHRAGLLVLGRFDLPGQLSAENRAKDAASAIRAGVAEFNFIRI